MKSPFALLTCLTLLAALSGCGQTGPLTLPRQAMRHGHKPAPAPAAPATTPATAAPAATPELSASTPSATTATKTGAATSEGAATSTSSSTSSNAAAPMVQMSPPSPAAGLAAPMANSNANSGEAINQPPATTQQQQ